jgi:hypothetical protein
MMFAVGVLSCEKEKDSPRERLSGTWVESTLRLDTLDFSYMDLIDRNSEYLLVVFKSRPYQDILINPDYPVNHSSWYDYYFEADKIFMRSIYSSSSLFGRYEFLMLPGDGAFTVKRFYGRNSLPGIIRFDRLP